MGHFIRFGQRRPLSISRAPYAIKVRLEGGGEKSEGVRGRGGITNRTIFKGRKGRRTEAEELVEHNPEVVSLTYDAGDENKKMRNIFA